MLRCRDGTEWGDGTPRILALLAGLLAVGPAAAAEMLLFRNDAKAPIVVQVVSVCRGVYRRDRPYLLRPGEATLPGVILAGDKVVTIYDAKLPNRVLFQGALPARSSDSRLRILPDTPSPRVRLQPFPATSP